MAKINPVNTVMQPAFSISGSAEKQGREKQGAKSIFAGNTALGKDPYQQKMDSARKQAMKLVKDAFKADQDYTKSMQDFKDFADEKRAEKYAAQADMKNAENALSSLQKEYGVDPESQEQKDLEWMRAYNRRKTAPESVEQMMADKKKAEEISANLTEYQSRALEADAQLRHAQQQYDDASNAIIAAAQSLTDAKIEKLKDQSMLKAQEGGEAIMEAAQKEVISGLWADGKDKMDQKVEEEQEKKEEEKKEEEKAEKIEARRAEEKAIRESMIEKNGESVQEAKARAQERDTDSLDPEELLKVGAAGSPVKTGQVDAALDDLKSKMAILDADLKGLMVDDTV